MQFTKKLEGSIIMRNLVVIPARGGSKGIPLKNIFPVNGKPLLEYTLEALISARLGVGCDIAVSTDSEQIATVAKKYTGVFVIGRPAELAADQSKTEDALLHALAYMEYNFNREYDNVITMQPTSPLRTPSTIRDFIKKFEENSGEFDAQLTLTETRSDYWIKNEEGDFERLYKNAPRRRQDRKPLYIENSSIYITSVDALKQTRSVLGTRTAGFVISEVEAIDINEPNDIALAESYLALC